MMRILLITLLFVVPQNGFAAGFDNTIWATLLQDHVRVIEDGSATQVDYAGFSHNRESLEKYLQQLSAVEKSEFDSWESNEQLAFLINSYNGWTVQLILSKYPDLDSIKDLGSLFRSPWKKEFVQIFGEKRSLDYIEHELIRGSDTYNDPRIHFAVNCASIGCPALRAEPYTGAQVTSQLAEATSLFLQDRSRNRVDNGVLEVSSIFKWYKEDFEKGWLGVSLLRQFLADHAKDLGLTDAQAESVRNGEMKIKYLKYDWALNQVP